MCYGEKKVYKYKIIGTATRFYPVNAEEMAKLLKEYCEQELTLQNVKIWVQNR